MEKDEKFRAFDTKENVMIDWVNMRQTAWNRDNGNGYGLMYTIFTNQVKGISTPGFILMRCVGYSDCHGKDIYVGDVFGTPEQLRCVVEQEKDGAYVLRFIHPLMKNKTISILDPKVSRSPIIGNIYEHPHLLTQQ